MKEYVPFEEKLKWALVPRPHYSYGMYHAALQAKALGLDRISAIEFGVAGGNGLVDLEEIVDQITREIGITIDIYGFDAGSGMPKAVDYRDCPYIWQPGFFKLDQEKLEKRLKKSQLILGDVAETISPFIEKYKPAPVGFIAFDLDYYSSTVASFKLFDAGFDYFIPRVFCYFDDIIGDDWELHCKFTGELLAIEEFNQQHPDAKIAKIHGLAHKQFFPDRWNDMMFVFHQFKHPLYNKHVNPRKDWQFELRG